MTHPPADLYRFMRLRGSTLFLDCQISLAIRLLKPLDELQTLLFIEAIDFSDASSY